VYIPTARLEQPPRRSAPAHARLPVQDHTTRESRGFAFVRYHDKRDAEV